MKSGSMEPQSVRPLSFVSDGLAEEEWILEDRYGKCVPLQKTAMLFLGREECDILLKSKSVDGQHAVLVYDEFVERFKVKDLTSINGTFVNESRIPEDTYVYVDHADTLRFGYDSMVYRVLASSRVLSENVPAAARPRQNDGQRPSPDSAVVNNESNSNNSNSNLGKRAPQPADDLPSWAAKEMEQMESPTSCLEDQLLLPGVLPPVMAECPACMAENRMECHDCDHQDPTPRPPSGNHSCGYFPHPADPRAPRIHSNGLPPRTRQDTPPSSLALHSSTAAGPAGDLTPTADEMVSQLEQLHVQSPPGVTTPIHRATSATGATSPSGNRRKSVRELYGQPSWWGEDDGDVYSYPHTALLAGQEGKQTSSQVMSDPGKPPKGRPTPRDSLEPSRPTTAESTTSTASAHPPVTPTRPAEAFTVVFENTTNEESPEEGASTSDTPPPSGQPLSQFVPSKIRKSFQERQQERQQGSKRRQRPPLDKAKSDASSASGAPARSSAASARAPGSSGRPLSSSAMAASRQSRPAISGASRSTAAANSSRLETSSNASERARKPPISKQRPSPHLSRAADPSNVAKRTAGQSATGSPRSTATVKCSSNPITPPKKNVTMRKSGSTDRLKISSTINIDSLKSYGDTKSYLFDRMFDGSAEASAPSPKQISSPPLLPLNTDKTSPARSPIGNEERFPTPPSAGDQASDAGTYTIEREAEEYEAARKVDLSQPRGCADGDERNEETEQVTKTAVQEEKAEVEAMEKEEEKETEKEEEKEAAVEAVEDEEEMDEPLSVCEMTDITAMDDVEQEEIELKTSNTPKWLTELQHQQNNQQPSSGSLGQRHSKSSGGGKEANHNSVTPNGDLTTLSPSASATGAAPSMPHAASSASLNSMPPMAMDGSGEYHSHRHMRGHHGTSFRHHGAHQQSMQQAQHPRAGGRHHTNSSGSSSGSNSSSVRQHKSTHHLVYAGGDGDPSSPTGGLPVHRTGSTVSLQLPPYGGSGKYPPSSRSASSNRSSARDAYVADVISATDSYNAMALAYHNHQLQQQQAAAAAAAVANHNRSASGSLTRKASESLITDVLSTSRTVRSELDSDLDLMSSSTMSMYAAPGHQHHQMFYQTPMQHQVGYSQQHSVPGSYTTPRHYHRLSYHESTGGLSTYSLLDSRLPHDTAGLLQDTEEVLNDMQHRVMLHANTAGGGHRARTAGSMDCIPYADEYNTDEDTLSTGGCSAPASGGHNSAAAAAAAAVYGANPSAAKRHSMSSHHYQRSSLEGVRRGSLPPSPGEPPTPTSSAFRSPRSVSSTTGDSGGSTKRSLGARIVEKSRENLQTSAPASSSSASSSSTTVAQQQASNNASPGAEAHSGSRAEFGRHSLKLPTSNCPGFTMIGPKSGQSPRVASSSWHRRKEYDARKMAARQSSTGSLGSSVGGPESGGSAGGSLESADASVDNTSGGGGPKLAKMTNELTKDLEVLARREDLTLGGGRRSAFSPLHSSPDSPGGPAATGCHGRAAQLPHGGFRSRSAAVLNEAGGAAQTYDGLMVSSILHLSTKLRRCSNEILHKMKKCHHLSRTPSPADDCLNSSGYSHINQELSESLNNLKAVEYQMQVMERALFPQAKSGRSSALGSCTEGEYLMELERINHELKGFTPIDAPSPSMNSDASQPSISAPFVVAPQPVAPIPVNSGVPVTSGSNGSSYSSSVKNELYY